MSERLWVHILLCPNCANNDGPCLGKPCDVEHPAWGNITAREGLRAALVQIVEHTKEQPVPLDPIAFNCQRIAREALASISEGSEA